MTGPTTTTDHALELDDRLGNTQRISIPAHPIHKTNQWEQVTELYAASPYFADTGGSISFLTDHRNPNDPNVVGSLHWILNSSGWYVVEMDSNTILLWTNTHTAPTATMIQDAHDRWLELLAMEKELKEEQVSCR